MSEVDAEEFRVVSKEHAESIDLLIADRDAQRLRADTAEAELKDSRNREYEAQVKLSEQHDKLTTAEQRIASHEKLLRRMAKHYERSDVRELHRAIDEIDAALNPNPNPEAESHE